MKYLFYMSTLAILSLSLLLSGCEDDSNSDACVYGVQQNLDTGNYDAVIAALSNGGTCGGAMTQDKANNNLAAAYMGKAGLTMSNLLGAVLDSNSTSALSGFMTSFATSATAAGLTNLNSAKTTYAKVATALECASTQTGDKGEACLYSGLVTLTESVSTLSALLGSETLALLSSTVTTGSANDVNSNETADGLDVTACAIKDANVTTTAFTQCTTDGNVTYTSVLGVDFNNTTTNFTASYTARTFTVGQFGQTTYSHTPVVKLINPTAAIPSPVTTSGLCKTDFTTCTAGDSGCYPCPVVIDGNATTTTTGLLSIVNGNDLNSLKTFLPTESDGTSDDIAQKLKDSIRSAINGTVGSTADITEAELASFLSTL